jgi:hypothetical protein
MGRNASSRSSASRASIGASLSSKSVPCTTAFFTHCGTSETSSLNRNPNQLYPVFGAGNASRVVWLTVISSFSPRPSARQEMLTPGQRLPHVALLCTRTLSLFGPTDSVSVSLVRLARLYVARPPKSCHFFVV